MGSINSKFICKIFKIATVSFASLLVLIFGVLLLYEPNIPMKEKLYALYSIGWGDRGYDDDRNILAFESMADEFNNVVRFVENHYAVETELTIFYSPQREKASEMADEVYVMLDRISKNLDVSSNSFSRVSVDNAKIVFGFDGNPIAYVYSRNGKKPVFLSEYKPIRKELGEDWYYFNVSK